jgi:hypothetical protein
LNADTIFALTELLGISNVLTAREDLIPDAFDGTPGLRHLRATSASIVATANPGCHLQIQNGLHFCGDCRMRVAHPAVLLAEAYWAREPRATAGYV